jgi:hypothetical protein
MWWLLRIQLQKAGLLKTQNVYEASVSVQSQNVRKYRIIILKLLLVNSLNLCINTAELLQLCIF